LNIFRQVRKLLAPWALFFKSITFCIFLQGLIQMLQKSIFFYCLCNFPSFPSHSLKSA
jgi:hypothetical protein